ncbi:MAG: hypothetical protein GF332_02745 [Candidatus Moranbacteria bacterium]|nr:hypothetical protein [Candidatus Moranbacteria bacterium]
MSGKKQKMRSLISILLAIFLGLVLIILFEELLFDMNKFYNPTVKQEYSSLPARGIHVFRTNLDDIVEHETGGIFKKKNIYYLSEQQTLYLTYKSIIYSCVIIPLSIFSFLLFHVLKKHPYVKPLIISLMIASSWLMLRLLIMLSNMLMRGYRNIGGYVILIILVIILGGLAYYNQKKIFRQREQEK